MGSALDMGHFLLTHSCNTIPISRDRGKQKETVSGLDSGQND